MDGPVTPGSGSVQNGFSPLDRDCWPRVRPLLRVGAAGRTAGAARRAPARVTAERGAAQGRRSLLRACGHVVAVIAALAATGVALAQASSTSYQVPRQSIDGGAQRSASASYTLDATIGQPDAGPAMTSASYELRGGFHRAAATGPLPDPLFRDGFEPT